MKIKIFEDISKISNYTQYFCLHKKYGSYFNIYHLKNIMMHLKLYHAGLKLTPISF